MSPTTCSTSGELGTQSRITSEASATPRGVPPSVAPCATMASIGPRPREATVTSCPAATRWPAMGRPMAPNPMNPMRMCVPPVVAVSGQANWGSHSAVPARSSSTMVSVVRRSPRPASGSSAKASPASVRSPRNAASTVSSCVATWRRTISS